MLKYLSAKKIVWELYSLIIIPIMGIAISLYCDDWLWFSRFGSVMVALSILGLVIHYAAKVQIELVGKAKAILKGREPPEISELKEMLDQNVEEKEAHAHLEFFVASLQAFLGTLIWGFGDLINRW
jgi:hypothetical protein